MSSLIDTTGNLAHPPEIFPTMNTETTGSEVTLWKGSPSQWLNLWAYVGALLVAGGMGFASIFFPPALLALVIPVGYAMARYLKVRSQIFELTSERLRVTRGIFTQTIDEIELYRVKDSQMIRTWWMRMVGLASISLDTSDRGMAQLTIPAVRGGVELREQLRKQVEWMRDKKRVREMDFADGEGQELM